MRAILQSLLNGSASALLVYAVINRLRGRRAGVVAGLVAGTVSFVVSLLAQTIDAATQQRSSEAGNDGQ
jgi:4-amino-4-deoxy-L-arabinose transferase-like glycosyltransferase